MSNQLKKSIAGLLNFIDSVDNKFADSKSVFLSHMMMDVLKKVC